MCAMRDDDELDDDFKSKSELKREAEALQRLGEELVALTPAELATLPLPENLLAAIEAAQRIGQHGARRRQLQYIGKLMRRIDAEPVARALEERRQATRRTALRLHEIERWRDRLLSEGDDALGELLELHPGADRSRLRQWMRNAGTEAARGAPPASARALFRYLRELLAAE